MLICYVPIKVYHHPSLTSSKGVIRTRELQDMDEAEIATELTQQGVTNAKRILIKKEDHVIKKDTISLSSQRELISDTPIRLCCS